MPRVNRAQILPNTLYGTSSAPAKNFSFSEVLLCFERTSLPAKSHRTIKLPDFHIQRPVLCPNAVESGRISVPLSPNFVLLAPWREPRRFRLLFGYHCSIEKHYITAPLLNLSHLSVWSWVLRSVLRSGPRVGPGSWSLSVWSSGPRLSVCGLVGSRISRSRSGRIAHLSVSVWSDRSGSITPGSTTRSRNRCGCVREETTNIRRRRRRLGR